MNKIAIIIANPDFSFSNANSAVANYLKLIANAIEKEGHQVELFPSVKSSVKEKITPKSQKGIRYIVKSIIKKISPNFFFNKKFENYFQKVNSISEELSLQLKGFDLVIEFCVFGSQVGANCKAINKTKTILIFDAPLDEQFEEMYGKMGKFRDKIVSSEIKSLHAADAIICYSNAVKKHIEGKVKAFPIIEVIPCIAWKHKVNYKKNNDDLNIGFIGSFLSWHKVELLLYAFNQIASKYQNIKLHLIGFGEEWKKINDLVQQSPFVSRIHMPGFVSETELDEIKSILDIGVMPGSNWYGSPLKLFEYAESGIPIIAPATPTVIQYFKHDYNALIIDSHDEAKSLIKHLEQMINSSELRKEIGLNGLKMMQTDFAKEQVMARFVNLITDILKK